MFNSLNNNNGVLPSRNEVSGPFFNKKKGKKEARGLGQFCACAVRDYYNGAIIDFNNY